VLRFSLNTILTPMILFNNRVKYVEMHNNSANYFELNTLQLDLFQNDHLPIIVIDSESEQIVNANNAAVIFYGYNRNDLIGMSFCNINSLPFDRFAPEMAKISEVSSILFNFQHKLASGDIRDVEVIMKRIILNDKLYLYAIIHDITNLKSNEEKVKQSAYFLQQSQRTALVGTYCFNMKENKFETSEVLDDIFGVDSTFEKTIEGWVTFVREDKREEVLQDFVIHSETRSPIDNKYPIIRLNDKLERWVHCKGEFNIDSAGIIVSISGTVQDITEFVQVNEALLKSEYKVQQQKENLFQTCYQLNKTKEELVLAKTKAEEYDSLKSAFLSNFSHEIRTPLNAIVGFTELLQSHDFALEKRKEYSEIIKSRADYLLHIIDDILELSIIEAGQLKVENELFSVYDLMDELAAQCRLKLADVKKEIHFTVGKKLPLGQTQLYSDKMRIQHILNNLLDNAIKFTSHGQISIECFLDNEHNIVFTVSDTGMGIAPENFELIFQRFRQTHDYIKLNTRGIGLGLSISLGIALLLEGNLTVASELGKGSVFSFSISSDKLHRELSESSTNVLIAKKKLLLIEDQTFNRDLIIEILNNYELVIADNGKEALELFSNTPSLDLILMDIGLPDINGLDVARQIRRLDKSIPIIAFTAYNLDEELISSIESVCSDYMTKPINTVKLIKKIEACLE